MRSRPPKPRLQATRAVCSVHKTASLAQTCPPEQRARQQIDLLLQQCGWIVQNRSETNLAAGAGVAIREALLKGGEADLPPVRWRESDFHWLEPVTSLKDELP